MQPLTGSCASAEQVRALGALGIGGKEQSPLKKNEKKRKGTYESAEMNAVEPGGEGWMAAEEGDESERWHAVKRMEMGQAEVERQERQGKRSRVLF